MRAYVRDVVERYKDSPAVWGWEFGNEYNIPTDLPDERPP
jgi:endo-1,4-beta-mannosidase